jgi:hypothetical protein
VNGYKRDEPWFLMTDLRRGAVEPTNMYGQRMTVEELFRDDKSKRNGFSLRHTRITKPDRIDRLLLVLALAYWLLCGIGLLARQRQRPVVQQQRPQAMQRVHHRPHHAGGNASESRRGVCSGRRGGGGGRPKVGMIQG